MLAKRLARVAERLVGEAHTRPIFGRMIQDNLHLIRYTIDRIGKKHRMAGALVHLDQSKAFDRFDHYYFGAFLKATSFNSDFRGRT